MASNQEGKQASFRSIAGTTGTFNEDAIAAFQIEDPDGDGVSFNERFISWLQLRTGSASTDLNGLQNEFASLHGFDNWSAANDLFALTNNGDITAWYEAKFYSDDMTDDGGGLISQWNDHSTTGAVSDNLTASGDARPTYSATGLNGGFPTVVFNATGATRHVMTTADSVDYDHATGFDAFFVFQVDSGEGTSNRALMRRYTTREMQYLLTSSNILNIVASTTGASTDVNLNSTVTLLSNNKALAHVWWDGTDMGVSVNNETDVTTAVAALNAPANTTYIGALNTTSGSLQGGISAFIYCDTKISDGLVTTMKKYLYSRYFEPVKCLTIGDSLSQYYKDDGGDVTFQSEGSLYFRADSTVLDVRGLANSYLLRATAETNPSHATKYWWDESINAPGLLLQAVYDKVTYTPDFVHISLGTNDRSSGAFATKTQFKNAYQALCASINARWPTAKILVQKIGTATAISGASNNKDRNAQWVRESHIETVDELSYAYFSNEVFDQAATDSVHPNSFAELGKRVARRCAELQGYTVNGGTEGATLVSASATGANTLTATISHDAGTDFTPTTGISGFVVFSDGVLNVVTAAARASATTINITTTDSLGVANTLYYIYGMMSTAVDSGYDYTQVVVDNSTNAMPLQAGHVVVA